MRATYIVIILLAACASAVNPAMAADAEAGLLAVKALGSLNGQALACSEARLASRARSLMLVHAPKTSRFGAAYEDATQAGFLAQTRSNGPCPDTLDLTDRLNRLALQFGAALPVVAPESN